MRCLWACYEEIIISVHLFSPFGQKMWLNSLATAQICCDFLWIMSNSNWGFCRSFMAVVSFIHFGLTYPLPTDNHQEFWKCCCSSWHTGNFRCPWACAWLGQLWKHSWWTRRSPALWALKAGLPFLFHSSYCHCFLLPRGAEHTWMLFGVWGVQNNYGSIFQWFWVLTGSIYLSEKLAAGLCCAQN